MNTNILNSTNVILNTFSTAVDFVQQQAPDIANQCITVGIWHHSYEILCGLMVIIGSLAICKWAYNISLKKESSSEFEEFFLPLTYFVAGVVILFSLVVIMSATSTLVSIIIAPKVYILKQILTSFK